MQFTFVDISVARFLARLFSICFEELAVARGTRDDMHWDWVHFSSAAKHITLW